MCPSLSKEEEEGREEEEDMERDSSSADPRSLIPISGSSGPYYEHGPLGVESLCHFTLECLFSQVNNVPVLSISLGNTCKCAL